MNYEKTVKNIRAQLLAYVLANNIKSLVIGISGGIDSCLCAALAKPICDKYNIPLIGRSLPITTNKQDEINRANLIGKVFCTDFRQENLGEIYNKLSIINPDPSYEYVGPVHDLDLSDEVNDKAWKIRAGNIKARLRMIFLYNLASMYNGMVLSTDNYTEYLLGFWTLHGDVGDYGMIQELWKSEVYDIAEWIMNNDCSSMNTKEAMKQSIVALATDGLGVTDTGDLGQILPNWKGSSRDGYKEVDKILQEIIDRYAEEACNDPRTPFSFNPDENPVYQRHIKSQFKRDNPVNINRNLIIE